ncbi:hypothetical protein POSPLADRAFT_1177652 [Postia placenta MAD-698-R-SB12]|uniref:Uncharacterized protein n=1 Tax=Postia placenta MAD-698-R-SB12 TaxID=670580 RepID=A0A1X6NC53_9APHY|nr:hypothetical protein POSPLADRAFT_1177652 [Postia placenta MAD-698-R-SB12]OSX66228.1 hypothetical protein POSPLADRAFT_1177652 [Postia placenta MAD-698-R-SB12]
MSLQGLISGSECAVPFNPLSQVLKHTEGDRSLQQDRIAGPSSSRLHHLPSTSNTPGTERDVALARQFFDGHDGHTQMPSLGPAFVANHLPPQLMRPADIAARSAPDLSGAWAEANDRAMFHRQLGRSDTASSPAAGWTAEFSRIPQTTVSGSAQETNFSTGAYNGMGYGPMMHGSGFSAMSVPMLSVDKGKGKGKEIDFDAAFAEAFASLTAEKAESGRIVDVTDEQVEGSADTVEYGTDFQMVWDKLQKSGLPPPQEDVAKWESQFNQLMSSHREEDILDYGGSMQRSWEDGMGLYDSQRNERQVGFTEDGLPLLGPYEFEKENRHMDPSTSSQSHLRAAKELLEQNGSLSEAALLLEAAIQQGDLGTGGYEAWILLGETRSMDEREEAAMRALTEGIKRAEDAGAAGEGMLSLAVAYTNETYERASHTMLLRWLSARFPTFDIPREAWESLSQSGWHSHERVTEVFLNLAREQYSRGEMDPDVQIALGVLFYTNSEYDRAKDCFEASLAVRPKDYLLWNRMGSCLSNGNKPEEALGAYREALQLRPTYTRAIYNVAVACLNIGAHKEAAEHLLSALAMQDLSGGAKSDQLWQTLRRVLLAMNRSDLAEMAKSTTNVEVFRKENFDF